MLPKDQRLRSKKDFSKVYRLGHHYQDKFLKLIVYKNDDEQQLVGFVVSKKVNKQAVKRNRIKRQLREAYRLHQGGLSQGLKMIFVAKHKTNHVDFAQLVKSMNQLLQLASVYEQKDYIVHS